MTVTYRGGSRAPDAGPRSDPDISSQLIAVSVVTLTSAGLAYADPRLRHWFLVPVSVCGMLMAIDAVNWIRGRLDVFDPQAMLGTVGIHFYYLAPILNVMLDHWPRYLPAASDWRSALGYMGLINAVGLSVYRLILGRRRSPGHHRKPSRPSRPMSVNLPLFYLIAGAATVVSLLAFVGQLWWFGGIDGYLDGMTLDPRRRQAAFSGLGWLIVLAEAFPMIIFTMVVVRWRVPLRARPGLTVLALVGLTLLQFAAGGLRGSRANTIWPVLGGLVLIHVLVRRISRKHFFIFLAITVLFMYVYGLYKGAGQDVLDVARGTRTVSQVSAETGRDLPTLLVGDLSRADIQALVLDRQLHGHAELAYGATYLAAVLIVIPRSILPHRPPDKVAVGTDQTLGVRAHEMGSKSTVVYGLAGEGMLNFGPLGGLASFVLLGCLMSLLCRIYHESLTGDGLFTKLITPVVCRFAFLPAGDFDNLVFFMIKFVLPGLIVAWLATEPATEPGSWAAGHDLRSAAEGGRRRQSRQRLRTGRVWTSGTDR